MKPTRRSAGDPSRLNRVAARRSSLRFGRNTPGIPPSRALSAGRLPGLGAHVGSTTGCSPRRCAPLIVALPEYTRYSSLTRLVSRAPPQPRRSRGFHHRLFTASLRAARRCASVEIHPGQFSRWGLLPHAPCQPGLGLTGSTTGCSPRRSRCASVEIHPGQFSRWGLLPHAPCQPGGPRRSRGFHHRLLPHAGRVTHGNAAREEARGWSADLLAPTGRTGQHRGRRPRNAYSCLP